MSVSAALRQMVAFGLSQEQALIVLEKFEQDVSRKERQAEVKSAQNRRYYEKRTLLKPTESVPTENLLKPTEFVLKEAPLARVDSNLLTKDISGKEVRKKERKEERASRLTTEFVLTNEMREYGRGVGLSDDRLALECANMRDWSLSSPNGVKLDWSATWRQWVRRAVATGPPLNSHRNGKSVHEAVRNLENYVENGGELDELFKIRGDEGRENSIRLLPQGGGGGGGNLRLVGSSGPVEILPLGRREGH